MNTHTTPADYSGVLPAPAKAPETLADDFANAFRLPSQASRKQDAIRKHMKAARLEELTQNQLEDMQEREHRPQVCNFTIVRDVIRKIGPATTVVIAEILGVQTQRVQSIVSGRRTVPMFVKCGTERRTSVNGRPYEIQIWGLI